MHRQTETFFSKQLNLHENAICFKHLLHISFGQNTCLNDRYVNGERQGFPFSELFLFLGAIFYAAQCILRSTNVFKLKGCFFKIKRTYVLHVYGAHMKMTVARSKKLHFYLRKSI